jgi:hypothetical protein
MGPTTRAGINYISRARAIYRLKYGNVMNMDRCRSASPMVKMRRFPRNTSRNAYPPREELTNRDHARSHGSPLKGPAL